MEGLRFSVARGCCDDVVVPSECGNCIAGTAETTYSISVLGFDFKPIFSGALALFGQPAVDQINAQVNGLHVLPQVPLGGAQQFCGFFEGSDFFNLVPGSFVTDNPGTIVETTIFWSIGFIIGPTGYEIRFAMGRIGVPGTWLWQFESLDALVTRDCSQPVVAARVFGAPTETPNGILELGNTGGPADVNFQIGTFTVV